MHQSFSSLLPPYTETIYAPLSFLNYACHIDHARILDLCHNVRGRYLEKYGYTLAYMSRPETIKLFAYHIEMFLKNEIHANNWLTLTVEMYIKGARVIFHHTIVNNTQHCTAAKVVVTLATVKLKNDTPKPVKASLFVEALKNLQ